MLGNKLDLYTDPDMLTKTVVGLFNATFAQPPYMTKLESGGCDPEYCPASSAAKFHRIIFANGFVASALHEVAHWCVAGRQRRLQYDYGYWYEPDGRSIQQQLKFLAVEARPQALEWLFTIAIGQPFFVSCDNLNGEATDIDEFRSDVCRQAQAVICKGLPPRAQTFIDVLKTYFGTDIEFAEATNAILQQRLRPG